MTASVQVRYLATLWDFSFIVRPVNAYQLVQCIHASFSNR